VQQITHGIIASVSLAARDAHKRLEQAFSVDWRENAALSATVPLTSMKKA
jgi:hypothetical protein